MYVTNQNLQLNKSNLRLQTSAKAEPPPAPKVLITLQKIVPAPRPSKRPSLTWLAQSATWRSSSLTEAHSVLDSLWSDWPLPGVGLSLNAVFSRVWNVVFNVWLGLLALFKKSCRTWPFVEETGQYEEAFSLRRKSDVLHASIFQLIFICQRTVSLFCLRTETLSWRLFMTAHRKTNAVLFKMLPAAHIQFMKSYKTQKSKCNLPLVRWFLHDLRGFEASTHPPVSVCQIRW